MAIKECDNQRPFLARILKAPRYGFESNGALYVPTHREIWSEFFHRLNIFASKKNWLPFFTWGATLSFIFPFILFLSNYFTWPLFFAGFVYSMVILGTHGTIYLHRYGTHRAYCFSHPFYRFIVRNLVIKVLPEEIYIISHHVHHRFSEKPGDPYNVHAGWLYCFLADANHQLIEPDLSREDYEKLTALIRHTGVKANSYEQYRKWGSLCHPGRTLVHFALNWLFWGGLLFLVGGWSWVVAIFGMTGVWAFGVRTFNYDGHGGGKDKRRPGIDFNDRDLSINQLWPGYVSGEWHNNHHLYPNGARAGFLPYQIDLAWYFIRFSYLIGGVKSYKDPKPDFYRMYYHPYLAGKRKVLVESTPTTVSPVAAPASKNL